MMLYAYNGLRHEYILLPFVYAHTVHVWIHSTLWNIHMTLKQWCKFAGSLLVCPDKTRIYPHASPILYHINLDRRSNFLRGTDDYSYDMLWLYTHHYLKYHPTTSSIARGAQLMDAGFINFLPGTHVEVNISMGYKDESSWPQMTQMANLGTLWLCQNSYWKWP